MAGHSDPDIRGGSGLQKFFSALRASVWSKKKGGRAPPLNPPQASPCRPFWGVPPSEGDTRVSAALPVFSPILLPICSQRTVFNTDTSVKWTPRVGPFLSLLTLFDSL